MIVQNGNWRAALRETLVPGEAAAAGAIFDRVRDMIPLHIAARAVPQPALKTRPAAQMRWQVFRRELLRYWVLVDPPPVRGKPMTVTATITPIGRPCAHCGKEFVGPLTKSHCSPQCRGVTSHISRRKRGR